MSLANDYFLLYHGIYITGDPRTRYTLININLEKITNKDLLCLDLKTCVDKNANPELWENAGTIMRKDLVLGKDFIMLKPEIYEYLVDKYKIDYPISRVWLKSSISRSINLTLETTMPKIKVLQVLNAKKGPSDYMYIQISEDKCHAIEYVYGSVKAL